MSIKNCLAAKHNPANACTDACKWPNACGQASTTVVDVVTIELPAEITEAPVTDEQLVETVKELSKVVKAKSKPSKAK